MTTYISAKLHHCQNQEFNTEDSGLQNSSVYKFFIPNTITTAMWRKTALVANIFIGCWVCTLIYPHTSSKPWYCAALGAQYRTLEEQVHISQYIPNTIFYYMARHLLPFICSTKADEVICFFILQNDRLANNINHLFLALK